MAEFGAQVVPFSSVQGCGDFAYAHERDDGLLVVVGDVAGHGDPIVGTLAVNLQKYIKENNNLSLSEILEGARALPGLSERGVSIFLGLFDRHLALLHYYLLGDIRAYLIREHRTKRLVSHEGALGIAPPELTRFHSVKAHPKDLCIIHSDGVRADTLERLNTTELGQKPLELAEQLMTLGRNTDDDAVCAVVRFTGDSNMGVRFNRGRKSPPAKAPTPLSQQDLPKAATQPKYELAFIQLEQDALLATVQSAPQARLFSTLLWEVIELDSYRQTRIETYLLEALERGVQRIDIYADNQRLQLQLNSNDALTLLASRLFGSEAVMLMENRLFLTIEVNTQLDRATRQRLNHLMSQQSYADYADRHRREGLLAQQAKLAAMGEMIGAIAHQWRQPLNELGLRIQQLQMHQHNQGLTTEEVDRYSADSLKLISHMATTIDDFRDFFSTHQDKDNFDVARVIDDVMRLQAAQLKNHNIAINVSGDSFKIQGHDSYLKQVLFNLISNSKDAFVEQHTATPQIWIRLNPSKKSLTLIDNAGGVTPQVLERIYEPYYTLKEHGKGTGLGLYMSRMLMLEHFNGSIESSNTLTDGEPGLLTQLIFGDALAD